MLSYVPGLKTPATEAGTQRNSQKWPTSSPPNATLSFPVLFAPKPRSEGAKPVYSCALLFDKAAQASAEYKAMQTACIEAAKTKFGANVNLKTLTFPFRDAGEKDYAGYDEGFTYINPWSEQRPGVVDAQVQDVLDFERRLCGPDSPRLAVAVRLVELRQEGSLVRAESPSTGEGRDAHRRAHRSVQGVQAHRRFGLAVLSESRAVLFLSSSRWCLSARWLASTIMRSKASRLFRAFDLRIRGAGFPAQDVLDFVRPSGRTFYWGPG